MHSGANIPIRGESDFIRNPVPRGCNAAEMLPREDFGGRYSLRLNVEYGK